MNIDRMVQGLAMEIVQNVQTTLPGEPGAEGAQFEEMLQKQSQAAKAQRKDDRPKEKTAPKQETKKPQESGTQDQETTEGGQQVAAALVTSQPVVPLELVSVPEFQYNEEGAVILQPGGLVEMPQVQADGEAAAAGQKMGELQQEAAQPAMVDNTVLFQPETEEAGAQVQEAPVEELPEIAQEPQAKVQNAAAGELPVEEAAADSSEDDLAAKETGVEAQPLFRRDVAAPTKVGEVYQAQEPENLPLLDQLRGQIIQAIQEGQSVVQLQLSPANLGKVMVEITRGGDGTLSILMTAATDRTTALLQQHSAGLQEILANATQSRVEVEVQQPQQQENANQFLNPEGQNRQHREQQQQSHKQKGSTEDFLQQLRLGLVSLDEA